MTSTLIKRIEDTVNKESQKQFIAVVTMDASKQTLQPLLPASLKLLEVLICSLPQLQRQIQFVVEYLGFDSENFEHN